MAEPVISDVIDDLMSTIADEVPALGSRLTYGPPPQLASEVCCWIAYGPANVDFGNLEVVDHTIDAVIAIPDNGMSIQSRYRTVVDIAQQVRWAMRTNAVLADEMVLISMVQGVPFSSSFGASPYVGVTVTLSLETKTDIVNLLEE